MIGPRTFKPGQPGDAPREGDNNGSPRTPASSAVSLPFPREVLIDAARQFARGVGWEAIAENTGTSAGDLVTFSIDHPETWNPLSERAEKLRLAEAEGETLAGLTLLLKSDDEEAAENAAREILIHRRHVERRRYKPQKVQSTDDTDHTDNPKDLESVTSVQSVDSYPQWLTEDPPPEEIVRRITYAAHRVAHGADYISISGEVGHPREEVTRWSFIYAKAWDKTYSTARRTAAQFGASMAINRLLDFVVGFDPKLAARAGRTLLVHRRHMHWGSYRGHVPEAPGAARGSVRVPGNAGEGAGIYPSSVTQGSVAIPGDGSLKVARRSGPARAIGTVRPSADSRPRDGPC